MSDINASALVLNGAIGDGRISDSSSGTVLGIFLKAALTGNLTISGVTQASGAPQSWVISGGTSGYVVPLGSKRWFRMLSYVLANPGADAGLAVVVFAPD